MIVESGLPPLAERMRPRFLSEVAGQRHLLAEDAPLGRMVRGGYLPSLLFWGPPGVGKTTLARLLAQNRPFFTVQAVQAGVKDIRAVLDAASNSSGVVLFIDEIHRFNKAQQDALLHAVESGLVTLIGATTENPSFEVIGALLSRMQVYVLHPLEESDIRLILERAICQDVILAGYQIDLAQTQALFELSGGDARKALNLLALTLSQLNPDPTGQYKITNESVVKAAQKPVSQFDKHGEHHYDIASAFIKSIRASDPNAALYYLARMLEGGESLRFICRRLIISASEDIGNANPNALLLAVACFEAVEVVGLPEARIILSQTVTYLATSAKSNAAYNAIGAAFEAVRRYPTAGVPFHLRNAPTTLMKNLGYGDGYKYAHDYEPFDPNALQHNLPDVLKGTVFYHPKPIGKEKELADFLKKRWQGFYNYGS